MSNTLANRNNVTSTLTTCGIPTSMTFSAPDAANLWDSGSVCQVLNDTTYAIRTSPFKNPQLCGDACCGILRLLGFKFEYKCNYLDEQACPLFVFDSGLVIQCSKDGCWRPVDGNTAPVESTGSDRKAVNAAEIASKINVSEIANEINLSDLSESIDLNRLADEFDTSSIASKISVSGIAESIDLSDLAREFDLSEIDLSEIDLGELAGNIDMDELSDRVRDGIDHDDLAVALSDNEKFMSSLAAALIKRMK